MAPALSLPAVTLVASVVCVRSLAWELAHASGTAKKIFFLHNRGFNLEKVYKIFKCPYIHLDVSRIGFLTLRITENYSEPYYYLHVKCLVVSLFTFPL